MNSVEPYPRLRNTLLLTLTTALAVALTGCPWPFVRTAADGEAPAAYYVDAGRDRSRELTYTLNLGESSADVYFAFVNYSTSQTAQAPAVNGVTATLAPETTARAGATAPTPVPSAPIPVPIGAPGITAFNNGGTFPLVEGRPRSAAAPRTTGTRPGDTDVFWQYVGGFPNVAGGDLWTTGATEIDATLRRVASDGTTTLRIWVHDEWWSDSSPATSNVTQTKVDVLADAFLRQGAQDDIYDWVTAIYGAPYGPHDYTNLIANAEVDGTVDILLLDVLQDKETSGGIAGFFWAKDLVLASSDDPGISTISTSNERLMFYIDAPLYAQLSDGSWASSDRWPQIIISTLAHEFQHMIHYYQNFIRHGRTSETWFNELLSMVTEDLIADKLGIDGPRGVDPLAYPGGGSGPDRNTAGRLPSFVGRMETGIVEWPQTATGSADEQEELLAKYAATYAYGAYLSRAYGGAAFAAAIMAADRTNAVAVDEALKALSHRSSFRETLSGWAASSLLSDTEAGQTADGGLRGAYNTGAWHESEHAGVRYRLGSINLYNYVYVDSLGVAHTGPHPRNLRSLGTAAPLDPGSVAYVSVGEGVSGTQRWDISLDAHTDLVVVVKPPSR